MPSVWLTSDPHFGHAGVCKFLDAEGNKLRPWNNPDEMDEALVDNWNSVVAPKDKVYVLGDVVINRRAFKTLYRLNGDKVLIKGNHDIFKLGDYTKHFRDIRAYHVMDKLMLCHIPIHPQQQGRFRGNIHGHLHSNVVKDKWGKPDPFYLNVCVEKTGFTPILFEEARAYFAQSNS